MVARFYLATLASCLLAVSWATTADAQSAKETLLGKWKLDAAKTRKDGKLPEFILEKGFDLQLEYKRDGTTSESFTEDGVRREVHTGRWRLLNENGTTATLEITNDKTGKAEKEGVVFLEGGDYIKVFESDPRSEPDIIFVLKRVD